MVFMLAKMFDIAKARSGWTVIRGLITTISLGLGLHSEVAILEPIKDSRILDVKSCLARETICS